MPADNLPRTGCLQPPSGAQPLCKATCGAEAGTRAALPLQTSPCHLLSGKMKWLMSRLGGGLGGYPGLGCWQPWFANPSQRRERGVSCWFGCCGVGRWVCGCSLGDWPLPSSHLSPQGWRLRDSRAPPACCGMRRAGPSPSSCPRGAGVGNFSAGLNRKEHLYQLWGFFNLMIIVFNQISTLFVCRLTNDFCKLVLAGLTTA